ncbi:MAG: hypothetical protein U9N01_04370 [Euryarchaeota archaeon]|nr:hypothetical protein [Euryarchaeota archaeon]
MESILELGKEDEVSTFADAIKGTIEEMAPDLEASVFSDLLTSAMGEVDWYELAESYLRSIAEIKAYEEANK